MLHRTIGGIPVLKFNLMVPAFSSPLIRMLRDGAFKAAFREKTAIPPLIKRDKIQAGFQNFRILGNDLQQIIKEGATVLRRHYLVCAGSVVPPAVSVQKDLRDVCFTGENEGALTGPFTGLRAALILYFPVFQGSHKRIAA